MHKRKLHNICTHLQRFLTCGLTIVVHFPIWVVVKVVAAFSVCNLFDNFVIQPIIYSKSVKAHPLEIFIVIMMAGTLAGVVGMILAIPVYTLVRIVAKEFFKQSKFVNKLTQRM